MLTSRLDSIGNWNAQLFRELKGRLKPRNVLLIIGLVIVGQLILLGLFYAPPTGPHCTFYMDESGCTLTVEDMATRWQQFWQVVLTFLNWTIMVGLLLSGVYMLAQDLDREEMKGTLNFIRLSPQSPRDILLGKLLGVPILFYLAILCLLPLHGIATLGAGAPLSFLISFYVIFGAGSFLMFSLAMLAGMVGRSLSVGGMEQTASGAALLVVVFAIFGFLPGYFFWNIATGWNDYTPFFMYGMSPETSGLQWFFLPLGTYAWVGNGFTLVNVAIISAWLWQAMERSFANPGKTLLPKRHSYGLVMYLEVLILGFCVHPWYESQDIWSEQFMFLAIVNLSLSLLLIALFSNQRQTLLDWSRFRHLQTDAHASSAKTSSRKRNSWRSLLTDLLFGENSPSSLLIPVNLLLMAGFMVLWAGFALMAQPENIELMPGFLLGGLLCLLTLMSYGAIAQLILMLKTKKRVFLCLAALLFLAMIPIVVSMGVYEFGTTGSFWSWVLLFNPFPIPFLLENAWFRSLGTALGGILAHLTVLTLVNGKLAYQLRQFGTSSSQELLKPAGRG